MRNFTEITDKNFEQAALEMYRHQYANNEVYGQFCDLIKRTPETDARKARHALAATARPPSRSHGDGK